MILMELIEKHNANIKVRVGSSSGDDEEEEMIQEPSKTPLLLAAQNQHLSSTLMLLEFGRTKQGLNDLGDDEVGVRY